MEASTFQKVILVASILCCTASLGYAQESPQLLFDSANQQLQTDNYIEAVSLYKNIEAQNTVSGALFLNLGISYQRMDSLGKAKYYFMKAAQFEETEEKAARALEFVETQFSRQSAMLPQLPWDVATRWLQQNIGASTLLGIGIILLNIGLLIYIAHWFSGWFPSYLSLGGSIIAGLSVLIMAAGFYTRYVDNRYSPAVMVTEETAVYEKPQGDASLISQAFEGYTFTVDHYKSEPHPKWKYVRMSNGLYGWIPGSEILVL